MIPLQEDVVDSWIEISAGGEHQQGLEQKLLSSATEHLGDERVLAVFRGQTHVSPLLLPLLAPLLFFFWVKPRTVIVTDKSIITLQESVWLQSKVAGKVSRYPCGGVPIRRTRLGLKIGDDATVFAMFSSLGVLEEMVAIGSRPAI
jgi:hypothetical protein